jgi:hypothetical protein
MRRDTLWFVASLFWLALLVVVVPFVLGIW